MRSLKLVALAAVAIFAIAACGGSGAATPTAAPGGGTTPTPASTAAPVGGATQAPAAVAAELCALLSPADLKAVTGNDYGAGVPDQYGDCAWQLSSSHQTFADLTAAFAVQPLSFIKSTFPGGVDVTVSGHAGYWQPEQGIGSLYVDVGGRLLVLSFQASQTLDPALQAIAQKLAETAIGKM